MTLAEIQRTDAAFKVYRPLRGFPAYYQDQKGRALAMIRQLGNPHLFLTLSAAEHHWDELLEQIWSSLPDDEKIEIYGTESLKDLDKGARQNLLSNNKIQTTYHFHRRMKQHCMHLTHVS